MSNLFPVDQAESYLRSVFPDLKREGDTLEWTSFGGVGRLVVEPSSHKTPIGLKVGEVVTLTHGHSALSNLSSEGAAHCNAFAGVTGVAADRGGNMRFVSRISIFEGDEEAAQTTYAPMLCTAAGLLGRQAHLLASGAVHEDVSAKSGLTGADAPVACGLEDFQRAEAVLGRLGCPGMADKSGLAVGFAWPSEGREAGNAPISILYVVPSRHPHFGNGLLSTLTLPVRRPKADAEALVRTLNAWESSSVGASPYLGGWCLRGDAQAFVTFVPNQMCTHAIPSNLAVWGLSRHRRVSDWLSKTGSPN